jgi:hypothetical protein
LAIGDEPAVVVDGIVEEEISNQREVDLVHDIDLLESVGVRSFEPFHTLDRRQGDPAEMMANQDPPERLPVDHELEMILDEPGRPMLPFEFAYDDPILNLQQKPLLVPTPVVEKPFRPFVEELLTIPFNRAPCATKPLRCRANLGLALDQLENCVFFNQNLCSMPRGLPRGMNACHAGEVIRGAGKPPLSA